METTKIAFPGLGIGPFEINPVAFRVFGHPIMWYGIIITVGIVAAFLYVNYRAKHNEGIKTDDVLDYAIYLVIFGIIGARLYYVFSRFDTYRDSSFLKTLGNIVAVWEGGLAIYGGILAGALALIVVSKIKKIKVGKALDMISPGVMLGQLIGRWGNFVNGEAYGWSRNVASLPWRMQLEGAYRTEGAGGASTRIAVDFVHPTFLYESLWNLLGFLLIQLIYKKKKYDGQIFLIYITWYGFGRMLIESLRTDSLMVGEFRLSQIVGFLCFFIGLAVLIAMAIVGRLRLADEKTATAAAGERIASDALTDSEEPTSEVEEKADSDAATDGGDPASEAGEKADSDSGKAEAGFEIAEDYADGEEDNDTENGKESSHVYPD